MRGGWFFGNLNQDNGFDNFCVEPFHLSPIFDGHLISKFASFIDGRTDLANNLHIPRNITFGAITCVSKFAGSFFLWLSGSSVDTNRPRSKQSPPPIACDLHGLQFGSISQASNAMPVFFDGVANTTIRLWTREFGQLRSHPIVSVVAAFLPPFDHTSSRLLSMPSEMASEQLYEKQGPGPCRDSIHGCGTLSLPNINLIGDAVEPRTGIKFPAILDNQVFGQDSMEVLVGTGYRTMRVIKVKTLNVYAFGLYIHPHSVCKRLGHKYGRIPVGELKNCLDFYSDLLREDIHMTVRLVVNCNGLKINSVRDAFEKSLRARLQKMNPSTDYHCLSVFGSYFQRDIPLPPGTTIDFRRTTDGVFVTEISGKTIGAVQSRDLCRAFFDMYVGDLPVSNQAKEELAENVAGLIRCC
ncbi:chalcone-flavanone isomerase family protein [Wolffia australiana]